MTTLVTGASGFLGRHLVETLVSGGDDVRALIRPTTDAGPIAALGAEIVRGDITDAQAVRRAAASCRLVYHLAGVVSHARRDLAQMEAVGAAGTSNLLGAIEPGARVVHVSSVAAIGPVSSPQQRADETHAFPPEAARLPYALAKRHSESIALEAAAAGVDVVVANPGFLLGPGDIHRVSTWPVSAYVSGRLRFTTNGGLSFVDVRDVAAALATLAERGRSGERTIIAADAGNLSWNEFFKLVAQVAGVRRLTLQLPRRAALAASYVVPRLVEPGAVRAASHWWFFTPAKAVQELGLTTRPLAETIADTLADHVSTD